MVAAVYNFEGLGVEVCTIGMFLGYASNLFDDVNICT
jgi:hypothetical protein